jgi:hypothetical protein
MNFKKSFLKRCVGFSVGVDILDNNYWVKIYYIQKIFGIGFKKTLKISYFYANGTKSGYIKPTEEMINDVTYLREYFNEN